MSVKKLGIVVYGKCKNRDGFWEEWLDQAKELINMMGYIPTHAGIGGTSLPEKLRTLRRSERKMRAVMANGEPVDALSIYSLPENYRNFLDNHCFLDLADFTKKTWSRNKKYSSYAYCEMKFDESSKELVEKVKSVLLDFVEMEECEIFTMDKGQVLLNYLLNKGSGEVSRACPTLEILSQTYRE